MAKSGALGGEPLVVSKLSRLALMSKSKVREPDLLEISNADGSCLTQRLDRF
jgi:hypothetical protein